MNDWNPPPPAPLYPPPPSLFFSSFFFFQTNPMAHIPRKAGNRKGREKQKKLCNHTRSLTPPYPPPPPPGNATLGDIYSSTHIQTPTPLPLLKITQLTCCRLSIHYTPAYVLSGSPPPFSKKIYGQAATPKTTFTSIPPRS